MKTLRIKLYRAIVYNSNRKIYIRDFAQHLRMIPTMIKTFACFNSPCFYLVLQQIHHWDPGISFCSRQNSSMCRLDIPRRYYKYALVQYDIV